MPDKVKAVPEGFHTLTPHITVRDARRAIDFYQKAFGAEVLGIHDGPEGKIMHATLKIGDSMLMLNDEFPEGCVGSAFHRGQRRDHSYVSGKCGRRVPACGFCRRDRKDAARRCVLGRPLRRRRGSVRTYVVSG